MQNENWKKILSLWLCFSSSQVLFISTWDHVAYQKWKKVSWQYCVRLPPSHKLHFISAIINYVNFDIWFFLSTQRKIHAYAKDVHKDVVV